MNGVKTTRKRRTRWLAAGLAIGLLGLSGCQAAGGADVRMAIQNGLQAKSYQAAQTMTFELIGDGAGSLSTSDGADLSALQNVTVTLDDIKKQDDAHISFEGAVQMAKTKVAFQGTDDQGTYTIKLDGASKPIVIHPLGLLFDTMLGSDVSAKLPIDPKVLLNAPGTDKILLGALANQFPNPSSVQVSDVKETVHGESLPLKKVELQANGSELPGMLKSWIDALTSDDAALKSLVGELLKAAASAKTDGSLAMTLLIGLGSSSAGVDYAAGIVKNWLVSMESTIDKGTQDSHAKTVLTADSTIRTDLYLDDQSQIRKTDWDVTIAKPFASVKGLAAVRITGSREIWGLNEAVQADTFDFGTESLEWSGQTKPAQLIKLFGHDSAMFDLLLNGIHLNRKKINMPLPNDNSPGSEENPLPYIADDTTLVPVRFVTERLDAEVSWNGDLQQVTVKDIWSGKTIVFTIGSNVATVDGQESPLDTSAVLTHNTTYVPARFIAETFGAKVGWDGDARVVSITKS